MSEAALKEDLNDIDMELESESEKFSYLIFRVGDQKYATPLVEVREVIEYIEPNPIPNMRDHFMGVINLRGEVVGVVDLRVSFGEQSTKSSTMLVFDTEAGPISAIVDRVISVTNIKPNEVEKNPNVKTKFNLNYYKGIANHEDEFIHLVDLSSVLENDDLVAIRKAIHEDGH